MPKKKASQAHKIPEIMREMAERLLRNPAVAPSSEAADVALFFANVAWNECVGIDFARESFRNVWESIEANNPALWNELKSNDIDNMVDELVQSKMARYPDDLRGILACGGTPEGNIRVKWLAPAAPGVDAKWEMTIYGLVMIGQRDAAIRFLQETGGMTFAEAKMKVESIVVQ